MGNQENTNNAELPAVLLDRIMAVVDAANLVIEKHDEGSLCSKPKDSMAIESLRSSVSELLRLARETVNEP